MAFTKHLLASPIATALQYAHLYGTQQQGSQRQSQGRRVLLQAQAHVNSNALWKSMIKHLHACRKHTSYTLAPIPTKRAQAAGLPALPSGEKDRVVSVTLAQALDTAVEFATCVQVPGPCAMHVVSSIFGRSGVVSVQMSM